ncbi:hypothetical protein LUX31_24160 [Streptomyces sp. GQFP]|nr:hypothetical protein [Streptomyces sp. GQFP]UIX32860.1 hypothetical protein LUX31_24160 [Streptomyces sp. GQFP]
MTATALRKLGSSDLEVFPLALGGNFLDTADSYSAGACGWVRGGVGRLGVLCIRRLGAR